jgi:phosphate transport system protein
MQRHFEKELEQLKTDLIKMGSVVEEAIALSIKSLLEHNQELARKVIDGDERTNSFEIAIDNAIVDLLALQQPVAIDLRLILSAQKINNDLERIGDHAVNIAESALALLKKPIDAPLLEIPKMAHVAQAMLRNALDGFIHQDPQLGKSVLSQDDIIDELNRTMVTKVVQLMKSDQKAIDGGLELIRVSRNLERVADLATNIAEEVIFITQARVVKHHAAEDDVSPS